MRFHKIGFNEWAMNQPGGVLMKVVENVYEVDQNGNRRKILKVLG